MPEYDNIPVEGLTQEEANRIIRSHRKVRYGTACWPCRSRKVKCDNKQPCENCVRRDHPQLCSYKPNRSSASKSGSLSTESQAGQKRAHSPDGDENPDNDQTVDNPPEGWPRALDDSESMELSRYVGQNSIPALLREQPSSMERKSGVDIRRDMRPILGLDNSAPFPLMSSKHLDRLTQDISAELPSDREVMRLFRAYKETVHQFWGFVVDIDDLESRIMIYLEDRSKNAREQKKKLRPVSASWLGILFAVLAVGSQFHDETPYHIRTRDSQSYIQTSFHFLRLGNFLLRPNLDSIQALLITSFVLLNDMKAEGSWALLGLTCRLAQSLGLHRTNPQEDAEQSSTEVSVKNYVRRKLWWTTVWHDTLTSLSFDRPNMSNIACCPIPLSPSSSVEGLSYLEAMYHLCEIISQRLNPDATAECTYEKILESCRVTESLRERVYPQLRSTEAAKTAIDRLQYYALRLHTAFVVSVCCRPALRRDCQKMDPDQKAQLAEKCKTNLAETVRMFLAMHQLSSLSSRSWAFLYHSLSSAVLLGILCEAQKDPAVRKLQGDLISALSATAAKEASSPTPGHIRLTDKDIELSGPLSRALTALRNIYDHGSLNVPTQANSECDSGTRTPHNGVVPQDNSAFNAQLRMLPGGDRHQDAALAMAELQNGNNNTMPMYTPPMSFQPLQQQSMALAELNLMDASNGMSPLDLYDSIFWDPPDPWASSVDMNFDFNPQPLPGQAPPQQFYF